MLITNLNWLFHTPPSATLATDEELYYEIISAYFLFMMRNSHTLYVFYNVHRLYNRVCVALTGCIFKLTGAPLFFSLRSYVVRLLA